MRRHALTAFAGSLLTLCSASAAAGGLLVVAPHPDDDLLIAAGITAAGNARGDQVKVVFVTNGDLYGDSVGTQRQLEAVAAQTQYLGTAENNLIFLGYPDAGLTPIHNTYPNPGDVYATNSNRTTTYASHGLGLTDYHSYRFGAPATYNWANLQMDLRDIIATYQPDHILTVAEFDQHPDHATTYHAVKEAIDAVVAATPSYNPSLHKTIVWLHDISATPSWPAALDPTSNNVPSPGLPPALPWSARESIEVPAVMQSSTLALNTKHQALQTHVSQGGVSTPILARFIHRDEIFWQQTLSGATLPPVAAASGPTQALVGSTVQLSATGSSDAGGAPLSYTWTQTDGPLVLLTGASTATPSFQAPIALQDTSVTFELRVGNGSKNSIPDLVTVAVVTSVDNIAPLATASASSENSADGQFAQSAIDGIVDGWPGDYTREWSSVGERGDAWLQLQWAQPATITRVVLHDRPNGNDYIAGGTLTFSDGSSVAVPPLLNAGGPTTIHLAARTATWMRFTVNSVGPQTDNVGLAEVQVFGSVPNAAPVADAGNTRTVIAGHTVQLDGSRSSDAEHVALTYQWLQTGGPAVALSDAGAAAPTFVAPPGPATLAFQLIVNDGLLNSAPATVGIEVLSAVDVDNNGLADAWESLYDQTDPNADPDHDGLTNLQEHNLDTLPADAAPTVIISAPAAGTVLTGTTIHFAATASDAEDGNLSASIQWHSNIAGLIGAGATLDRTLPPGNHTITASVIDSKGAAPANVPSRAVEIVTYLRNGDINDDGNVDVADLLLLQQYLNGTRSLSSAEIARGDLYPATNGDGQLTLSDLLLLAKLVGH